MINKSKSNLRTNLPEQTFKILSQKEKKKIYLDQNEERKTDRGLLKYESIMDHGLFCRARATRRS